MVVHNYFAIALTMEGTWTTYYGGIETFVKNNFARKKKIPPKP